MVMESTSKSIRSLQDQTLCRRLYTQDHTGWHSTTIAPKLRQCGSTKDHSSRDHHDSLITMPHTSTSTLLLKSVPHIPAARLQLCGLIRQQNSLPPPPQTPHTNHSPTNALSRSLPSA
jgi:hypothetical protein